MSLFIQRFVQLFDGFLVVSSKTNFGKFDVLTRDEKSQWYYFIENPVVTN